MSPLLGLLDLSKHGFPGSLTQTQNKNQRLRSAGLLALTAEEPGLHFAARHELFGISLLSNAAKPFFSPPITIKPSYGVSRSPEWGMSKLLGKIGVISRKLFRNWKLHVWLLPLISD